tara:strand:+ start:1098 stop:1376 length:279 start_codon:yes stop_codon:yes gene_type:complete
MAKKEKVVDLKPQNITKEQLEKLQATVSNINKHQMEIGRHETAKHALCHLVAGFQDELKLLQAELEKEYGTVNINIETGQIMREDEQADKKN